MRKFSLVFGAAIMSVIAGLLSTKFVLAALTDDMHEAASAFIGTSTCWGLVAIAMYLLYTE